MNRDDLYQEVTAFLVEQMDVPSKGLNENSHLVDDLEIDSLSVLELTVFTEERYNVSIEDAFKETLRPDSPREATVGWLVDVLEAATSEKAV